MRFRDRKVVVTGACGVFGTWIAEAFAREGATLCLSDMRGDDVAALAARLGPGTLSHATQLMDDASMLGLVRLVEERWGAPDILVNNAGVYPRVPLLEMRESDWDHVLNINLKAGCFATIAMAKALIASGKQGGSVINLSSSAIRGAVRGVHYSASKGGVVSMTRALALELAPHGIRVNAIAPGLTDTAQPRYGNTSDELVEMARTTIPLGGRLLTPEQIARTAVFLASDQSNATTGQVLHVNGGSYMP